MEEKEVNEKVKELKGELSHLQQKYFDAINWLFFGERATGRTHLLAVVCISAAVSNPGQQIHLLDHYPDSHMYNHNLRYYILSLLKKQGISDLFEVYEKAYLVYNGA